MSATTEPITIQVGAGTTVIIVPPPTNIRPGCMDWCDGPCVREDDGYTIHRGVLGTVAEITVGVERISGATGWITQTGMTSQSDGERALDEVEIATLRALQDRATALVRRDRASVIR